LEKQKIHLRLNAKEKILIPKKRHQRRRRKRTRKNLRKRGKKMKNKSITTIHHQTNLTNSKNPKKRKEMKKNHPSIWRMNLKKCLEPVGK
jgi:surface antigen